MTVAEGRYLLGMFDGRFCYNPDEITGEEAAPCYYTTTGMAREAGRALLARHEALRGFTVRRISPHGHYRTIVTEGRTVHLVKGRVEALVEELPR